MADSVGSDVVAASRVYFAIDARLQLGRLRDRLERTSPRSHWERRALAGLHADLVAELRRLKVEAFNSGQVRPDAEDIGIEEQVAAWLNSSVTGFGRWQRLLAELERQPSADLAMLSVAVRFLGELHHSESVRAAYADDDVRATGRRTGRSIGVARRRFRADEFPSERTRWRPTRDCLRPPACRYIASRPARLVGRQQAGRPAFDPRVGVWNDAWER